MNRHIAIVCNYQIKPDRIGGMDRFFRAFNTEAEKKEYTIDWFFTNSETFEFYTSLHIKSANNQSIESFFLNHIKTTPVIYDVVITHFLELCTSFYKNVKEVNSQTQIIAVDHNPRPYKGYPLKKRIKNKIKGLLYSKYIDVFVGVSNYTKKHILKDYGAFLNTKTKVIHNGIDTSVFEQRTDSNTNKFIVASHLRPSKGIQDLIEAVNGLDTSLQNKLHIDIFGEGPIEQELQNQVASYNLQSVIYFKGSSSNLNTEFKHYSYLLQPTYMECFSLSILESLSANVPVITTEVGGNLEVITDNENGFVFTAGDVNGLQQIITDILTNNKTINLDVSKLIKDKYTIEKMVNQHLNLLECI